VHGVDPNRFVATTHGSVIKTPGRYGYYAFRPAPIPRRLHLSDRTILLLSEADRALGRLAGAGRILPNPHLLLRPYLVREALASNRIEGTQASLSDVFDVEADARDDGDQLTEVTNYIEAFELGRRLLDELPISTRFLCRVHEELLTGVRGQERDPGQLRRSQNWIGSADNTPDTAVFVPPTVDDLGPALTDFERFVHDDHDLPPLVATALAHYQFETIHPFLDGNGRLGRLLIVFLLIERDLLPSPLLYLSGFFESHRSDYYDRLQAVRERGEMQEWLQFFLTAVTTQAADAVDRAEQLVDLREEYRQRLTGRRARLAEVVDLVFENPIITSQRVAGALGITDAGAKNLIRALEEVDILVEGTPTRRRKKRWIGTEVLAILDPD
jgi:Fic family protein